MKGFSIFITITLCFNVISTFCQSQFIRTYNYSTQQIGCKILASNNDIIFLTNKNSDNTSNPHLLRINHFGDTLYTKTLYADQNTYSNNIIQIESNFILAINNKKEFKSVTSVVKLDSLFNIIWEQPFSVPEMNLRPVDIVKLNDNSIVVYGNCNSYNNGTNDFFILKLSSEGKIILFKVIKLDNSSYVNSMIETNDGDFIFYGELETEKNKRNIFVCRTNTTGKIINFKTFYVGFNSGATFIKNWQESLALGGFTENRKRDSDGFVLFLNKNMDSTSIYFFDTGLREVVYSGVSNSDELIVTGNIQNINSEYGDIFILIFDKNNNLLKNTVIEGLSGNHSSSSIALSTDNKLLIGSTSYNCSALLLKTDFNVHLPFPLNAETTNATLVSPNPSKGKYFFSGNDYVKKCIVYTPDGSKIIEIFGNEIDLTNRSSGIYFYTVEFSSGKVENGKLIKTD